MGLNERRKIKELQETTFPERVKEIEEILAKESPTKLIGKVLPMTQKP